jgi:hypothetical protein
MRKSTLSATASQHNDQHRTAAYRMRLSVMTVLISVTSLLVLGTTFAVTASASSGSAPTASASHRYVADYNSYGTIFDDQTRLCLDSNFSGDVYTDSCNGGDYQNWDAHYNSSTGWTTFTDDMTGLCLDSNNSGDVYTDSCNGGYYQNWDLVYVPGFAEYIQDDQTGRVLDSNYNGDVYTNPLDLTDYYQGWWFEGNS